MSDQNATELDESLTEDIIAKTELVEKEPKKKTTKVKGRGRPPKKAKKAKIETNEEIKSTEPKIVHSEKIQATREYFMLKNVSHDNVNYKSGEKFKGNEELLNLFLSKKFIEIRITT